MKEDRIKNKQTDLALLIPNQNSPLELKIWVTHQGTRVRGAPSASLRANKCLSSVILYKEEGPCPEGRVRSLCASDP